MPRAAAPGVVGGHVASGASGGDGWGQRRHDRCWWSRWRSWRGSGRALPISDGGSRSHTRAGPDRIKRLVFELTIVRIRLAERRRQLELDAAVAASGAD
ncbi:hypothetical protein M6B38_301460 [Iris pallida]|uniref:Uncharacterized protein n=1 Tax=Iris pallida TaxID=29817 RepID=A0AAX6HP72_IRIPA|nr:hypothetical protein M6B38_301460 [Iris pallida]